MLEQETAELQRVKGKLEEETKRLRREVALKILRQDRSTRAERVRFIGLLKEGALDGAPAPGPAPGAG